MQTVPIPTQANKLGSGRIQLSGTAKVLCIDSVAMLECVRAAKVPISMAEVMHRLVAVPNQFLGELKESGGEVHVATLETGQLLYVPTGWFTCFMGEESDCIWLKRLGS